MRPEKKRWKDRTDGWLIRSLDSYNKLAPYIMKTRGDAQNMFSADIDITEAEKFIRRKRAEGMPGLGMLHFFIASYVRTVSQLPGLNRFVSGRRIYARRNIEVIITIKKDMSLHGSETSIKMFFEPTDTINDVYQKVNAEIAAVKSANDSEVDSLAKVLDKIPRGILRFTIGVINMLDYFGKLPKALLKASPFHGSLFVTDLGSLGIPPVFHHLYDFGNIPIFVAFGIKSREIFLKKDGTQDERRIIGFTMSVDDRTCDGYYYAKGFKTMLRYFKTPDVLNDPPEKVVEDLC